MEQLWEKQLALLLTELNVTQEGTQEENLPPQQEQMEERISFWQISRLYQGVSYYVSYAAGALPDLHVFIPDTTSMRIYHLHISPDSPLAAYLLYLQDMPFEVVGERQGMLEGVRERLSYQNMLAGVECMKELFWRGDQEAGSFSSDIVVKRLA